MTTEVMAFTPEARDNVVRSRQKPRKPTARLVSQLERELVEAKKELTRKSDDQIQALNARDVALNERDSVRRELASERRLSDPDRQEHQRTERRLHGELGSLRDAFDALSREYTDLRRFNRRNFDNAARSGDVSAVLVKVIIAETDEGPVATMKRFIVSAEQMGVSLDVLGEIKNALTRGFSAQVEEAPVIAAEELLAESRTDSLDQIRDEIVDGFDDYLNSQGEHPLR